MASRLLSLTHRQNLIQKASTHGTLSLVTTAKTSPEFQCAPRFHYKRHFYSSPMLQQEKGFVGGEDTFGQWHRATGGPRDVKLQIPKKMPYKKGQHATEHITQADVQRYLYPLFLRGWQIRPIHLSTRLVFASEDERYSITEFIDSLQYQEKHDIVAIELKGPGQPSLYVQISTHDTLNHHGESIGRGITLRDARFAALLEKELHQRSVLFVPERPGEWNEETISQFLAKRNIEWNRVISDLSETYL